MIAMTVIAGALNWLYDPYTDELVSPLGPTIVHAEETVQTNVVSPISEKEMIQSYIRSKFGEDSEKMITIIGTCENGNWDQKAKNTNSNGTKDHGIAQINDANAKLCRGLDYQKSWKDNIDCAHRVYKSQGLSAWACSSTVGIKSFWEK